MYHILTLNEIAKIGIDQLDADTYCVSKEEKRPDGILLRSFSMHDMELCDSVLAIARAGAGTNNIPVDKCSEKGIVVFNTPGANANAVKELVLAGLFLSSRKIAEGIAWTKALAGESGVEALAEKGKSQFVGPEIQGKRLGVIGLGAIGVLVANAAKSLGMEVLGFDPFLSVDAAWSLSRSVRKGASLEEVVAESDYITVHVPLNEKTKGMYGKDLFAATKKGARLLNFARGELVDMEALKVALLDGTIAKYVTDFPTEEALALPNTIVLPHLGASTPESEENCAEMAALELKDYLEYGNIKNSVNFPECFMPYSGKCRIAIAHRNIPNMVSSIATIFAQDDINIDNMINKSKGKVAYTMIDADEMEGREALLTQELNQVRGVFGARLVRKEEV